MGRFIIFEGNEAAGKDTQSKLLFDFLREKNIPVEMIEYPGHDRPIGRLIRDFLNNKFDLSPEIQALLYATEMISDRERINSWLSQGKYVIANRYFTSTLVYQSIKGVSMEKLLKFAEFFEMPKPDTILLLKISPKISMERKSKQKPELDRHESDKELLEKVSIFYDDLSKRHVFSKWIVLDGEKTKEEVFDQVKKTLQLD